MPRVSYRPASSPLAPALLRQGITRDNYGRMTIGDVIVGMNGKPVRTEADLFGGCLACRCAVACSRT